MTLSLSADQQAAFDAVMAWVGRRDRPIFSLGGIAGTGKTTITGVIAKTLQEAGMLVAYGTFTGRASSILAKKLADQGVVTTRSAADSKESPLPYEDRNKPYGGTLHRFLYKAIINGRGEVIGYRKRVVPDRQYALIITDEASMIGDSMLKDIRVFNTPILAIGDHGQLPPVGDKGSLMARPDVRLEKIHRQAEGNPIIELAHSIRQTGRLDRRFIDGKVIAVRPRRLVDDAFWRAVAAENDTLDWAALCWTNQTRVALNRAIRKALGFSGPPKAGEPLVCLRNETERETFNGMRGVVVGESRQQGYAFQTPMDFPFEGVRGVYAMCGYQFHRPTTFGQLEDLQRFVPGAEHMNEAGSLFDFAYCMTVHKMQGSAVKHAVIVCDRPWGALEDTRRFYYTAVTRASERITFLV